MSTAREEHVIDIPTVILDQEDGSIVLLVSAPDGMLLEFPLTEAVANKIDDTLINNGLWSAFFTSLIQSMQNNEEHNPS
jgi:hypothetical protein